MGIIRREPRLGGGFVGCVGRGWGMGDRGYSEEAEPFSFSLLDLDDLSLREQLELRDI